MNDSFINQVKSSLKKAPEVLGKDKYFNSAVLIPLIYINNEYNFLFEKRSSNIRQGGEVSFPGGEFDSVKDKDYRSTAIRETIEEIGIEANKINIIGRIGTFVGPMGVTVDPFVGVINLNNLDDIKIDSKEVEKVFMIPVSYFFEKKPLEYFVNFEVHPYKTTEDGKVIELLPVKKLKLPERYSKPWKGRKHRVLVYETDEETVWGITAELVYEFCKLISGNDTNGNK